MIMGSEHRADKGSVRAPGPLSGTGGRGDPINASPDLMGGKEHRARFSPAAQRRDEERWARAEIQAARV